MIHGPHLPHVPYRGPSPIGAWSSEIYDKKHFVLSSIHVQHYRHIATFQRARYCRAARRPEHRLNTAGAGAPGSRTPTHAHDTLSNPRVVERLPSGWFKLKGVGTDGEITGRRRDVRRPPLYSYTYATPVSKPKADRPLKLSRYTSNGKPSASHWPAKSYDAASHRPATYHAETSISSYQHRVTRSAVHP